MRLSRQLRRAAKALRNGFCGMVVVATGVMAVGGASKAETGKLVFSEKPKMLDCGLASTTPCFRIKFSVVDAQGVPLAVPLPSQQPLAPSLTVHLEDQDLNPFFARASAATQNATKGRLALILIDISGSMEKRVPTGETRFEAAKAAVSHFLEGFESDVDRVAIVPFESHHVAQAILHAQFATTRDEAQRQVNALPAPRPKNNTALYSAVDIALDQLEAQLKNVPDSTEASLFVLTDGENDVQPRHGDDPDLLSGSEGLQRVADKIRLYSKIQVIAIGFGDAREVDQEALRQMSNKFKMVTDAEGLKRIFQHPTSPPRSSAIQATFSSPWPDRASLAARTLRVRVSLQTPTGEKLESDETTWSTPEIGVPVFEGKCDASEAEALVNSARATAGSGWMSALRPILVFASLGVALLVLWFWVPRLVWADQYVGSFQPEARPRWSGGTVAPRPAGAPIGRPAPPGFEQGKAAVPAPQRKPGDQTTVLPVHMMGTRTRLELKLPPEEGRKKQS